MKKYSVLVRGENFSVKDDGKEQKFGFYTTAFVEAQNEVEAEDAAIDMLRNDQEFGSIVLNEKFDSPMMYVEEIHELESFDNLTLPRTGFSFFPDENANSEDV